MSLKDRETHVRVLTAASRLFAANGFEKVTVREICRAADANVAAVNYHFGDKLGLYREVLAKAIETMQSTTDAARQAGTDGTSEQKLRAYIRVFLQRVIGQGHDTWIHQLMAHEIADPTPALDLVIDEVIRPHSSSSMAAVGNDAAGRPGAAGGEAAGAGAPPRSTSRTLSIIALVSQGLVSWPSAPAF